MSILDQIIADKERELVRRMETVSIAEIERRAALAQTPVDFLAALRVRSVGLIAEVKRRSPSAGLIRTPFDPVEIALSYERGGAQALSVLMDGAHFGGGEDDFSAVRAAVRLPMLYKEFVVHPWQVAHARAIGASAVLLIVAALSEERLRELHQHILELGMTPLIEVHGREELEIALDLNPRCIGVNNRNLKTFETRLETTYLLVESVPNDVCLISESGIATPEDVLHLKEAGVRGVLVGESLLRKPDVEKAARELMQRV
ncbi:MAG: indole-3-glycerol phosphate synthase TrpC [Kiritimatiellae bacterium]|nr:indole-3-glycerol phosphate synthase TrpC [Kiritimatiellia bacterium]MCO5061328.1 indole-3-glycerol phosphate synthase TrpC [Kiritimatiellia bacterium]MCO5067595.1 indole-3-glycerol phosphate synthase TrpC [Kiritimatiellia bacterium]